MRDDELQVLGKPQKLSKRDSWIIVIVLMAIAVVLGFGFFWFLAPEQPERIRTGEKMGESTIVPGLQEAVDSLLDAKLAEINGIQGQVIVMEVETGEILAMVGRERNFEGKFQPCKNFAYQQELGSLMKTASLLAALETGKVKLTDVVDTGEGLWTIDNYIMRDHNWRRGGYGKITVDRALGVSSNIGIGKVVANAFGNNQQGFFNQLEKMSYGQPDSIDGIEGLKPTSYSSPKDANWTNHLIWWSAIGYERKIAPIQMLTFYNAIANGGKMVKPTLKTGEIEIINPQIASKASIDSMQVALEHVVSQGLGGKAGTRFVPVAGKTGTSQVAEHDFGEDICVNEYQVAFCGYFPADKPLYSMIVSMNKLGLPASGGGMSGALFREIAETMIFHGMPTVLRIDEETGDTIKLKEADIN